MEQDAFDARDAAWAKPVSKLSATGIPPGAVNLNVNGRELTGPMHGFGQMWRKIYRARLSGAQVTPAELIQVWKREFQSFWPKGNRFYGPLSAIEPGEVAVLNLAGPGGVTAPGDKPLISTGILVMYADDTSFSFITPEGHPIAGWNTFSAYEEDGCTVAQVECLVRASDPIFELTARLGIMYKTEDDFWQHTVSAVAARFGVQAQPQQMTTLIDPNVQWAFSKNVFKNAAVWSGLYILTTPFRWVAGLFRPRG